jgi:hypothetical protein
MEANMEPTKRESHVYTASATVNEYYFNVFDCTSGPLTATLPEAKYAQYKDYYIERIGAEGNDLTIARTGSTDTFTTGSLTSFPLSGVDEVNHFVADVENNRWLVF